MKKIIIKISFLLIGALSVAATAKAQEGIARRIEVTRQYIPEVGAAEKIDFMPAEIDTVALHPDIDYSIKPTPWNGVFNTEPITPIEISTARYMPRRPFFLRLAAGIPLQSLVDFYATANTSDDVALGAYLNHYGRWAKIENDLGNKERATATHNVIGAFLEKRFARKTLTVDISDTYRYYRAFSGFEWPFTGVASFASGDNIGYNDLSGRVVFGDSFLDFSRFNYRVGVSAGTFNDRERTGQNDLGVLFDSGWRLYGGDFTAGLNFGLVDGTGAASEYDDWRVSLSPKYAFKVKDLKVGVGLDFVYNNHTGEDNIYIFPEINITYDKFYGFIPYLRIDGALEDGSFRSLSYANPYLLSGMGLLNPSHYDFRLGAHGSITQAVAYDLFLDAGLWSDYNYFVNALTYVPAEPYNSSRFAAIANDNVAIFGLGGAVSATIARGLTFDIGFKVGMVSQSQTSTTQYGDRVSAETGLGIPRFVLDAALKYNYRDRLYLSAGVEVTGKRTFSTAVYTLPLYSNVVNNDVPAAVNLKFDAEYKINSRFNAFVRGDNLLNKRLYCYNYYPELGANVMLGVKVVF